MAVGVRVPATFVATGWGTPKVCVRHGEPAMAHKRVRFISRVPGWAYALLIVGVLPFLIVVLATRKEVRAAAWPFCVQCAQQRKSRLLIGIVLLAAGFVGLLIVASLSGDAVSVLLLIAMIVAGFIVVARGNRMVIAGGNVVSEGQEVEFAGAHQAFVAEVVAAQQAAAQYYAQQQAYAAGQPQMQPGQPFPAQPFSAQPNLVQPFPAPSYPPQAYPAPTQPFPPQPYPAPTHAFTAPASPILLPEAGTEVRTEARTQAMAPPTKPVPVGEQPTAPVPDDLPPADAKP